MMIASFVPPFYLAIALTICVVYAIATDIYAYKISNKINLAILALFPIAVLFAQTQIVLSDSAIAFALFFAIGYGLFAFGIAGGGDVKMLSALSVWVGWGMRLMDFLVVMAVLGGIMTLGLLVVRQIAPYIMLKTVGEQGAIPRLFSHGQPVPYGVAIGLAFLWLLWSGQLPVYVR
jgi:prepilin peptidase CpaA